MTNSTSLYSPRTSWNSATAPSESMCTALYDINTMSIGWTACSCTELFSSYTSTHNITNRQTYIRATTHENHTFTNGVTEITYNDLSTIPPDNCCGTRCSILANDVQLLFWPIKSKVNSSDFTLVTTPPNQQGVVSNAYTL